MRVLFVTQAGDGHLNPLVPLARALVFAGHDVVVATSPPYVADVARVGLDAVGIGPAYRWDAALDTWPEAAAVPPEEGARFWLQTVHRDITVPIVRELQEHVRTTRPDLVITEYAAATWGQAICDLEAVPFVGIGWAVEPGYDDALVGLEEGGANEARARLGLPPIETVDPVAWVTFTQPSWGAFDGPPLATTLRCRLPVDPSGDPVPGWVEGRPFVYATLGTVFFTMRRLLRTFIAAIDSGGWTGLVTVGRNNDPARFDAPPAVAVEHYVAQADALAVADVMVCHGGLGSMLGAMARGCPMVVVPLGADQLYNAQRAAQLGIARVIDPASVTENVLRSAIDDALDSPSQRAACDAVRKEIAGMRTIDDLLPELLARL